MKRFTLIMGIILLATFAFLVSLANAVMLRVTPDVLVDQATNIVRGNVTQVQSFPDVNGEINTSIVVDVTDRLKGDAPDRVKLIVPGGLLAGRYMVVSDHPDFEAGQDVVLFLDEATERIVGQIQGKFTIEQDIVRELSLDADLFIESIRDLASGFAPPVDLDIPFLPVSAAEGLLQRLGGKFAYNGLSWDAHTVYIYINENSNQATGEGNAVKTAMQTWTNVPAKFTFSYGGSHSRTSSKQNFKNEVLWSNSGYGSAIAYAACWGDYSNNLVECDLVLINSGDYTWSTNDNPNGSQMDVQNICTHEFGHFLQLLDLYNDSDWQKTMYGYAGTGETYKRSLTDDDKNGIIHIYGSGPGDDDDDDDDTTDDDDDSSSDDDDSSGNDDDDVEPGDMVENCSDLMDLVYSTCDFQFIISGSKVSGSGGYDMCQANDGPWDCIFTCANHDLVSSCDDLLDCLSDRCDLSVSTGSGDDDDDDGGSSGLCG